MPHRDLLVQHYIQAYGIRAVYAAGDEDGSYAVIGTSANVDAALRRLRPVRSHRVRLFGQWWCRKGLAQAIAAEAASLVRPLFEVEVVGLVHRFASAHHIRLMPYDVIVERAQVAVVQLERSLADSQSSPRLLDLNRKYYAVCERRRSIGLSALSYPVFVRRYAIGMLYEIARRAQVQPAAAA